ncbi:hypothetical protein Kpol_543p18 [Vanderwaltozyma polyspora DSM 70294]|uniref:Uncharacterized protein n=1 Tax=Vanderwaltozyma polyspora (strain ATCC 22028 / DSM 70294 / BCRC 21397 / CBS 2163 / NBRC 10782 / NRRL Y-8283 / UCD 57-17) TaxID=436907 RepID=A7THM3_VANPO|nr:uncharacterized protein Kpol_543p18 [Vanderwaltozyma polyspora DSM 70294]EDO18189.1 hypothetical protein Kpol_543p18 [Vanderwaltozyma polyspora DSM 70294]
MIRIWRCVRNDINGIFSNRRIVRYKYHGNPIVPMNLKRGLRSSSGTGTGGCGLLQKSMSLNVDEPSKNGNFIDSLKTTKFPSKGKLLPDDDEKPIDFMNKLPEELISGGNGLRPTRAENEFDSMKYFNILKKNGFNREQSELIVSLLFEVMNTEFFNDYNNKFLRSVELDNQSHLFHVAETELKYTIQNSRETKLNEYHLQLMKLNRDLDTMHDELHGMLINYIQRDSKVDFNNQKIENTLLVRTIKLALADCSNRITTKILGKTKSDIENLRWQTTRSGLLAITTLVFVIMWGINISKKITEENEKPVEVILHTIDQEENEDKEDKVKEQESSEKSEDIRDFELYYGRKFDGLDEDSK